MLGTIILQIKKLTHILTKEEEEEEEENVTYSDRICHLPDDLLIRILLLIPLSDAMTTSLLSKRWRSLWKMMPILDFDRNSFPKSTSIKFDQFCSRALQLHKAPVLETLKLNLMKDDDTDSLIFPSIRSIVFEIAINASYNAIRFPKNLIVFQTLVVLKLKGRILLDTSGSPVFFWSLKSLSLECVKFSTGDSFRALLSSCPNLEDLFIRSLFNYSRGNLFSISVTSLSRLSFTVEDGYFHENTRFKIIASSLNYLTILDPTITVTFDEDMPNLVEADVFVHPESNSGKFLKYLTSVEHLSIHSLIPTMSLHARDTLIFNRVLHLKVHNYETFHWNLLMYSMKSCPNLRSLTLNNITTRSNIAYLNDKTCVESKDYELEYIPECLSSHLETLQWINYRGTQEEKQTAIYIFKHALCLKSATISLYTKDMKNDKMIMMVELESMYKASTSCQFVIEI